MENATKALIIAGAILIAILLISVGIMVFNSANDTIDNSRNNMNSSAINTFNSKFTRYFGDNVSASDVKSLLEEIRSSNATDNAHQIVVTFNGSDGIPRSTAITTAHRYTVDVSEATDAYDNGYIHRIQIDTNN